MLLEKGSLQDIQEKKVKRKMAKMTYPATLLAETFYASIYPNDKKGRLLHATVFTIRTSSGRS